MLLVVAVLEVSPGEDGIMFIELLAIRVRNLPIGIFVDARFGKVVGSRTAICVQSWIIRRLSIWLSDFRTIACK